MRTRRSSQPDGISSSIALCRIKWERRMHSLPSHIARFWITEDPDYIANADEVLERIYGTPDSAWRSWDDDPPREADAPIVARDCLGYVHVATHMIGSKGSKGWPEDWIRIPLDDIVCDRWIDIVARGEATG